ncbi:UrcA family protein [Novosphingobium mangrovi (ex Huang et al. 2023)]|uniref:UrcA family protein n=1 Tax=Novosphingobium mangrovi (ex Huang et al. 2023) TaxID=2976432 RepID=A0ABT2I7D9_9SPHN|nr:UrcA family protein [Novosphingobium mangrovi (ex Huang et al. 2023)]MCT2400741.1 UrcA family protein [Novosphingobium mangrovi (ex Huang et al. 2023)]
MTKPAVVLLAAITAFAGLAPSQAMSRVYLSQTVKYADLDLNRPSQVAVLDRRLNDAVWAICGKRGMLGIDEFHDWRRCLSQARASAKEGREVALAGTNQSSPHVIIEN